MTCCTLLLVSFATNLVLASESSYSPVSPIADSFLAPSLAASFNGLDDHAYQYNPLLLRQVNACSGSFTACSNWGQTTACCSSGTVCTTDDAAHVACCPKGAACTGTIGAASQGTIGGKTDTTTMAGAAGGTGGIGSEVSGDATPTGLNGQPTLTVTVSGGAAGGGAVGATTITAAAGDATGTVANAPYPYVYIPHSFANAAQCSSYITSCAEAFASCTASLGGDGGEGGNNVGVTITGAGITTANGVASGYSASAASVCSSLSTQACYGLQTSQCSAYGSVNGASEPVCAAMIVVKAGAAVLIGMMGAAII